MKLCFPCQRGLFDECLKDGKCKKWINKQQSSLSLVSSSSSSLVSTPSSIRKHGAVAKELKDPKSTGRKRAALLYPLDKDASCEWRNKKNCGGGRRPIIGCLAGKQQHRHHGPVKDTTRNHEGNVHRICTACHNHWHELNDLIYSIEDYAKLPHDPMDATIEEIANDSIAWMNGDIGKKYELASTKNHSKHYDE